MDSAVFKYKHHCYQQQQQHLNNNNNNNNSNHNNSNQSPIFILDTATNNILPNNPKSFYADLNENNVVSSSPSSSVWSSASSTMCSPAAHAIQKLFNCSSNSLKLNQGNHSGIETKSFKTNSELLKKKAKFWKYLEGEANDKNTQRRINNDGDGVGDDDDDDDDDDANDKKDLGKSYRHKSKHWLKSPENNNQNHQQDLSKLLESSCSLCDNCRCIDCQIAYFDCENSDDSNSEYSFHLSAYEEDDDHMELKTSTEISNGLAATYDNCCTSRDNKQLAIHTLNSKTSRSCCQQCCLVEGGTAVLEQHNNILSNQDH